MMISTRGRYALRVMIDLAEHKTDGYIPMKEVAARQEISLKYLERILPVLVKNGLVEGVQGKGGGYRLSRAPEECTVGEILRLTEGNLAPVACLDCNAEVCEKKNTAYLNRGVALCKYTGARGKSGSSDASAELIASLRALFDKNKVLWQMGSLGKVDQGGGGTVAMYMAERNIDTIDAGVPVLSMHSPFETVAKSDVFMTYKAICAFYKKF